MSRRSIGLDLVLLVIYLVASLPALTGTPAHEWIGMVAAVALACHCAFHGLVWPPRSAKQVFRLVLNIIILATLATVAISGMMVSGTVLPTFGLYAVGYYLWNPLHALSAKLLLALLLIHVALNIGTVWQRSRHAHEDELREENTGEDIV